MSMHVLKRHILAQRSGQVPKQNLGRAKERIRVSFNNEMREFGASEGWHGDRLESTVE